PRACGNQRCKRWSCQSQIFRPIPQRQSRHVYDLYKLSEILPFDENMFTLLEEVRRQRCGLFRCPSAEPDVNLPDVLREIVSKKAYKEDYNNDTVPLLYETAPYEQAVQALLSIAERIGAR
ncbi:MAG: nucleotidyl transferase AbiEii/AbiGii toxin family protein, partial [Eggerthellaceae bacterium]|nr:nucleotidyl transferase AbiEii/AbiGii toxin family protein [Eggerthellaceae bacterium]